MPSLKICLAFSAIRVCLPHDPLRVNQELSQKNATFLTIFGVLVELRERTCDKQHKRFSEPIKKYFNLKLPNGQIARLIQQKRKRKEAS